MTCIVLIDLLNLMQKQLQTIQISDTEYVGTMSTKNRTRRTTTRNIRFPNQMIEQINIALEQKSNPGQPGSLKPAVGGLTSEKSIYITQHEE